MDKQDNAWGGETVSELIDRLKRFDQNMTVGRLIENDCGIRNVILEEKKVLNDIHGGLVNVLFVQ